MQKAKSKKLKVEKIDILHVAKLANLSLSPAEEKNFGKQLSEILGYINKLNEVDTVKVEPIGQITGLENVTKEDEAAPALTQKESLQNAPRIHNGFFEVDALFREQ